MFVFSMELMRRVQKTSLFIGCLFTIVGGLSVFKDSPLPSASVYAFYFGLARLIAMSVSFINHQYCIGKLQRKFLYKKTMQ